MNRWSLVVLAALWAGVPAQAAFEVVDTGETVTVTEDESPVFVYQVDPVPAPEGVDERFTRSAYIHPLYGLRGEILSQDFPGDHFHHRGLFWTWPGGKLGDREFNIWALEGAHPHAERVEISEVDDTAVLDLFNRWSFDDTPEVPFVREHVTVTVHPATETSRAIDFEIHVKNVSDEVFSLGGSGEKDKKAGVTKGYGGFCFRPDAAYKPMVFTTANGLQEKDVLEANTPWADVSFTITDTGLKSGVAMFQHPSNPGYPHPGWIFRHYAFLGASYPHTETLTLQPNEGFELKYRLFVHSGDADAAKVAEAFAAYQEEVAR